MINFMNYVRDARNVVKRGSAAKRAWNIYRHKVTKRVANTRRVDSPWGHHEKKAAHYQKGNELQYND